MTGKQNSFGPNRLFGNTILSEGLLGLTDSFRELAAVSLAVTVAVATSGPCCLSELTIFDGKVNNSNTECGRREECWITDTESGLPYTNYTSTFRLYQIVRLYNVLRLKEG